MSEQERELERFEAELRQVRPARPPTDFLQRLKTAVPQAPTEPAQSEPARRPKPATRGWDAGPWQAWVFKWLVPATAVLAATAVIWRAQLPSAGKAGPTSEGPVKADDVQIDRQLVSTFDAVAPLDNGEPVRFRCRQWMDEVVLRDSKRGVEVTRRVPRLEVVPVRFETY